MREQLNFRQKDIQWGQREGRSEGRTEGITEGVAKERAERTAKEMSVFQLMLQEGKLTREQMEYFFKRMEEVDEKQKSSANLNKP